MRQGSRPEGTQTTQYSVVDAAGNAVSVTYTLNNWFGAGRMAPGTGIVLNDEMDDFTSKPGTPNMFGLVQGAANAIAAGKTPLSSMSPTIVTKDGHLVMVVGSPGGSRIITITLEAIINVIDHGMTVQEAVDAPRIHMQGTPDVVQLERRRAVAGHARVAGTARLPLQGFRILGRGGGHSGRQPRAGFDRGAGGRFPADQRAAGTWRHAVRRA